MSLGYHTKCIIAAEEIEADRVKIIEIETWTEDKCMRIELIKTLVDDGQLFHLAP